MKAIQNMQLTKNLGLTFYPTFIFADPDSEPFPLPFATALFSFLYHLASYESGMFEILNIIYVKYFLFLMG